MIDVKDLTKIYDMGADIQVKALNGVSFSIDKGEYVAIIGPSGSGKSTLMNVLGCLDIPTTGNYSLDGELINNKSEDGLSDVRNRKIGFVFQSFNLISRTSALKNVEVPMIYSRVKSKDRQARAKAALERVGLGDRLDHMPNELSGGQKQRVAIARALVNNPAIILADEPTGNLDTKATEDIMSPFDELNNEGKTIIIVTHEMDVAKKCKRILSFRDGRLENDTGKL